ncbi:MAG TPA: ribose 5-phosphate isomerase B [Bacteriovoracaceae bacterium]|nr:ribose 5-phosphate isomerase B [Bacteriovoracaceae bacterium]
MKIHVASDHAAFNEKSELLAHLIKNNYEVIDLGTYSTESTNYPEWAKRLVEKVQKEKSRGILLCGSGIGVSMTANRYQDIRAALCRDEDDARMSRLHNDANVLCLSGRKTSIETIKLIAETFLTTQFEGGRHQARIDQFNSLGEKG